MTLKKIRSWLRKHWFILIRRPTNGAYSMKELDDALLEIRNNSRKVCMIVEQLKRDTDEGERMMKEDVFHIHSN